jgi:hypothetical protein
MKQNISHAACTRVAATCIKGWFLLMCPLSCFACFSPPVFECLHRAHPPDAFSSERVSRGVGSRCPLSDIEFEHHGNIRGLLCRINCLLENIFQLLGKALCSRFFRTASSRL